MAISLKKNGGIILDKGLNRLRFTVRWGSKVDVDIQAMVLKDNKSCEDEDLIFYGQTEHPTGAVKHSGDVRDGSKVDGDDESIDIILSDLYPAKNQVVLSASIDKAIEKGLDFGNIGSCVCELIDLDKNEVIATYQVDKDLAMETCGALCELKKDANGRWGYFALGQAYMDLATMLTHYGFVLADE